MLAVAAALGVGACSDDPTLQGTERPLEGEATEELLAAHRSQADEFIGTGREAFEERLDALKGIPVVVNQWASWCGPCRFELPFFDAAAERFDTQVAFLGLDSQDERDAARAFLREHPSGFPSVFDPDAAVARSIGAGQSWPTTVFYDARGEQVHVRPGAYATRELLEADIRRHALGE